MTSSYKRWIAILWLQAWTAVAMAGSLPAYPSPTVTWTVKQYSEFYFTYYLTHLALPHLRRPDSQALFERLVDRGNIDRLLASPATAQAKERELWIIMSSMGAIRGAYNLAVVAGEPLQEELTRVQIFNLYLARTIASLSGEASASPAFKTTLLGVVESLSEREVYSPAQIAALSDAAARAYAELGGLFPDGERDSLATQIAALDSDKLEPETRRALDRLLATVMGY